MSLSPNSKVNARELTHALLSQLKQRGNQASGFMYGTPDDNFYYFKKDVSGEHLPLKLLPRDAKTVCVHTRMATQGNPIYLENNHPVVSTDNSIALVHNGVIWNDYDLKKDTFSDVAHLMPEVDSSVIPEMIATKGVAGISEISGDMAVAWLESGKASTLQLARFSSNPIAYTWLTDGSFVFASTPGLLMNALIGAGIPYVGNVFEFDDRDWFSIKGGVIVDMQQSPEPLEDYNWYSSWRGFSNVRAITSGQASRSFGSEDDDSYDESGNLRTGSTFYNKINEKGEWEWDPTLEDEDEVDELYDRAMALLAEEDKRNSATTPREEYYTIDTDGDYKLYTSLDALETELLWYAGLHAEDTRFPGADGKARWVENFADVGSFELGTGEMLSWVDQPDDIINHENYDDNHLGYIREGVGLLARSKGA